MTPTPAEIYKQLANMTPEERLLMLEAENPFKKLFEKKREDAFNQIRAYIDNRIKEFEREYQEDYGENYIEAMYSDKVPQTICQTDDFDKLVENYFNLAV